ncbi:maleylpyruvate isomerase family mycothiol-dependent enzyme [Nocardioides sp. MAH-18]|uniref:Maleylpyruvate isomerase family mycothiol-dependent enzyme n=1 Tax=Nocardioides agri TaxID=2682843 RepID=A0A6L6XYR1_9ACTN|nr:MULTISPECIES: maleylpyruvate isomerase family mycothiol-dependent enzyme [unclassified Nocardioides]MBA2952635.1 maleylpyruvate isomerase family mycothiol-dependent enzyme [Nocardioides sp. CGMCC 1.13656]MVQ51797.1 maleylpyruvate isomerase family mycothiol-dependent enzyme [Nocardioides sp. MAH-18]
MSASLVDRTIAALRHEHDVLVALLPNLPDEALDAPSGASEWTVAQALSHLGSGAEITRKPIARAAGESVDEEDDQSVWARWDSSSPVDQAAGFVRHDTAYLETVEALSPEQRQSLTVDLGFLPEPAPLEVALGMRLNEVANHAWDVRAGLDPAAEVTEQSAEVLAELFRGPLAFLLGFSAKPGEVSEPVRLAVPGGGVVIDDGVAVVDEAADPTATLEGAPGATVRLLTGRLRAPYDAAVSVSGNVSLDDLRRVFPGY